MRSTLAVELFQSCIIAVETGILPKGTNLNKQDDIFLEVFYDFLIHYRRRKEQKIWAQVSSFTGEVLTAVFGGKK